MTTRNIASLALHKAGLAAAQPQEYEHGDVIAEVETITPEVAKQWLKLNTHNRPINQVRINKYAQLMREGKWALNGESVKLTDNELLDGQHRLWAIVAANIPIRSVVVYGVDRSAFTTIDTGKARTAADILAVKGNTTYRRELAALAALVWAARNNHGEPRLLGIAGGRTPTHEEILEVVEEDPTLHASLERTGKIRQKLGVPHSAVAFVYWTLGKVNSIDRDRFFTILDSGMAPEEGNPAFVLRELMIQNRNKNTRKLTSYELMAYMIKGWNAFRQHKAVRVVVWKGSLEAFPVPI